MIRKIEQYRRAVEEVIRLGRELYADPQQIVNDIVVLSAPPSSGIRIKMKSPRINRKE